MHNNVKLLILNALEIAEAFASKTANPIDDFAVKACIMVIRQMIDKYPEV